MGKYGKAADRRIRKRRCQGKRDQKRRLKRFIRESQGNDVKNLIADRGVKREHRSARADRRSFGRERQLEPNSRNGGRQHRNHSPLDNRRPNFWRIFVCQHQRHSPERLFPKWGLQSKLKATWSTEWRTSGHGSLARKLVENTSKLSCSTAFGTPAADTIPSDPHSNATNRESCMILKAPT
jgi:hypothetical protein